MADQIEYIIRNLFIDQGKGFMTNLPPGFWDQCCSIIPKLSQENFLILEELYIECYRDNLNRALDHFWDQFNEQNNEDEHKLVFATIDRLHKLVGKWLSNPFLKLFTSTSQTNHENKNSKSSPTHGTTLMRQLHYMLHSSLLADMPLAFTNYLLNTFTYSFTLFDCYRSNLVTTQTLVKEESSDQAAKSRSDLSKKTCICKQNSTDGQKCYCENFKVDFERLQTSLRQLGCFKLLCGDIIRSVTFSAIEKYISRLCQGMNFDKSCLQEAFHWLDNSLLLWVQTMHGSRSENILNYASAAKQTNSKASFGRWMTVDRTEAIQLEQMGSSNRANIRNFIVNTYIYCRMKQLFEIIVDFPYSEPVLLDLHECIKIDPFYRRKFIQTLKSAIETRLLHPGVATGDIIEAYITFIRALRLLDPQGIILQIVCDPVRSYLKAREDTVRCIITWLTSDNLVEEFGEQDMVVKSEDELAMENWLTWGPQPIGMTKVNHSLLNADIISMLVNIFDSKDLFVQEYQRLLSQRLLASRVDLELEHRNLELLSLRFGESELHTCQVMLKDLKDSERVNQRINTEGAAQTALLHETNALILSRQFWPENLGFGQTLADMCQLRLPEEVQASLDTYTKAFETIKADRTLNWVHQLGTVQLELELNTGQTIEVSVRPVQAVIIYQFQEHKRLRISELAELLDLPPSTVRRQISYWLNMGLLVETSPDTFVLDEQARNGSNSGNQCNSQVFDNFADEHEQEKDSNKQDENWLHIFWNFIDNMLKNLHALTLDRIFSMLKMFYMQSPEIESLTLQELRQFLDRKVKEGDLVYRNGVYSLKTNAQ